MEGSTISFTSTNIISKNKGKARQEVHRHAEAFLENERRMRLPDAVLKNRAKIANNPVFKYLKNLAYGIELMFQGLRIK